MSTPPTIRAAVLTELRFRKWSINQLAKEMQKEHGIGRTTIHRWLSNRGNITDKNVDKILRELGLIISKRG